MSGWQRLRQVEIPLALPVIIGGLRTATVEVIASATLAAFIGAGAAAAKEAGGEQPVPQRPRRTILHFGEDDIRGGITRPDGDVEPGTEAAAGFGATTFSGTMDRVGGSVCCCAVGTDSGSEPRANR